MLTGKLLILALGTRFGSLYGRECHLRIHSGLHSLLNTMNNWDNPLLG